ncbi:MAG: asparagine synthase (glutamine-hydrolyzing) [Candidatus Methylumidiphilus sp.]
MCGIAGIFLRQQAVESQHLDKLASRIAHRGPDKIKTHIDGALGLAHARLSIIDLAGGDQPLFADDGLLVLIANGEIYNFIELRRDLETLGAVFATHSDCEAILHAYRHYGENFLEKLNGMFAFALYDKLEGKLLLARDRLGMKPLFFAETGEGICFASEQKALFPMLPGGPSIQPEALIQSLETGFNTGMQTIVAGVERIQPGELVTFKAGRVLSRRRYWSPFALAIAPVQYAEAAQAFEVLMGQVMLEHMRSDVPFALFLSGGVDSSVVLEWLRREEGTRELAAYTVAIDDAPNQDDLDAAKSIGKRFGLRHNIIELSLPTLFNHLPFAVWAADDFIVDHAILPTSLLAREAARDFKVVFSGEGGDELFAGYGRYRRTKLQRWLANLRSPGSGGFRTRGQLGGEWRKRLLCQSLRGHLPAGRQGFVDAWRSTPDAWSDLQRMQYTDLATELPDQLLVKVDRMLMAWGLEGRVPLLDHRLVEFALCLPDELKVQGREGKLFLKRWAEPIFGAELIRRPKRGFSVHVGLCLQGDNLLQLGKILPGHRAFSGIFEPAGIAALISRQASKQDVPEILWALLQFAVWHRIFIEGKGGKPDVFANPIEFIASS